MADAGGGRGYIYTAGQGIGRQKESTEFTRHTTLRSNIDYKNLGVIMKKRYHIITKKR